LAVGGWRFTKRYLVPNILFKKKNKKMHKRVPDTHFLTPFFGGWWLVVGGWWLVVGGWWLVVGCFFKQVEKKKRMKLRKK